MAATTPVLRIAVERPSKDEHGNPVHNLLDITSEGNRVPDRPREPDDLLAESVRRIFQERGVDFFDRHPNLNTLRLDGDNQTTPDPALAEQTDAADDTDERQAVMTTEQLNKMRGDILQQLFVAHGELSLAQELLGSLLPAPVLPQLIQPAQTAVRNNNPNSSALATTVVAGQAEIIPVQAYNAQLVVGSKDEGLRTAATILSTAATDVERGRVADERYWVDALKLRRSNWGLMPAPIPLNYGHPRNTERSATDFLVSCGLEGAPPALRRRAVGQLANRDGSSAQVEFRYLQNTRLRVTLVITGDDGRVQEAHNTWDDGDRTADPLEGSIRAAQREIVDHEVFSAIVREAATLPTASASVSEQLTTIEAAQGIELRFELVSRDGYPDDLPHGPEHLGARCDLIHASLQLLLVRAHARQKTRRWAASGSSGPQSTRAAPPPVLRPLLDIIQYETFCERVWTEVNQAARVLSSAAIHARARFSGLGDSSSSVLHMLSDVEDAGRIGGEAILRINHRHTIRLGLLAPSSLIAHLSHATLPVASIPQLIQLLSDEAERCLLERIRELGQERYEPVSGTWFIDALAGCAFGRWDGGIQSFRVSLKHSKMQCSVFRVVREHHQLTATYDASSTPHPGPLFDWVLKQINEGLAGEGQSSAIPTSAK